MLRDIELASAVSDDVRYTDLEVLLDRFADGLEDELLAAHCRAGAIRYRCHHALGRRRPA